MELSRQRVIKTSLTVQQKDSQKWLDSARRALEVLAKASCFKVVALKPENMQVLIRASANCNLVNGEKLFGYASSRLEA